MAKRRPVVKTTIWRVFLGIILSLVVFTDIRLFLLYLVQSREIGYYLYGLFYIVFFTASLRFVYLYDLPKIFWLVAGFLLFGLILDISNGLGYGDSLMQSTTILCLPIAIIMYQQGYFSPRKLSKIIFLTALLHLTFIIYSYFDSSLVNTYTGYGGERYLGTRAVGIFQAPGVLSFYSIIIFSYGVVMALSTHGKLEILISIMGIVLGLLSGNRSFLLSLAPMLLLFLVWTQFSGQRSKNIIFFYGLLIVSVATLLLVNNLTEKSLGERLTVVLERFERDLFFEDYKTRLSGDVGLVPGLLSVTENPLIGNTKMDERTQTIMVSYKNNKYSVNNGFISIIAYRGIPAALIYYYFYFSAFIKYKKFFQRYPRIWKMNQKLPFLFMAVAGSFVCMADSFLTSPLMIILLLIPFLKNVEVQYR